MEWKLEPDEKEWKRIKRLLDSVWDVISDWGKWMSQVVVDHLIGDENEEEVGNGDQRHGDV